VRAPFGTYPDAVLSGDIANRTGTVGRLISISAVGGVIAAAMALPVIATTGVVLRDQANKAAAPASASFGTIPQRSEILDANGHLMAYVYGVDGGPGASASGIDRQPVTYDQISPVMRQAIVAIEDNRFWQEGALDLKGTMRALVNNLQHKAVQGGSSITQQYVKNMLILSAPNAQQAQAAYQDTLSRKLHELRLAITVAHQQSKQQILTGTTPTSAISPTGSRWRRRRTSILPPRSSPLPRPPCWPGWLKTRPGTTRSSTRRWPRSGAT
jgi:membrane peptidoglycan carboxypeptidase